jgi:hypothetical protein
MADLVLSRVNGTFTEAEHHKIAAELSAMSDKWDAIELSTGVRPSEAFNYSCGLIMGRELIISAPAGNINDLLKKIRAVKIG